MSADIPEITGEMLRELADAVTPAESAVMTIATLHGRDNVPPELEQYLTPAARKLLEIGWITYTRLMATKEAPKPAQKKSARKRARKK